MFVAPKFVGLFVWVVAVLRGNFVRAEPKYCDIESCSPGQQTLCLYPNNEPGPSCEGYVAYTLTYSDRNRIILYHNNLRVHIAHGLLNNYKTTLMASNMKQLKWDDELAEIAQRWAYQCLGGHDACRNVPRFSVGQNIATQSVPSIYHSNLIFLYGIPMINVYWFDESLVFNNDNIQRYRPDDRTRNFTQMIWADTSRIGCSLTGLARNGQKQLTLICNYGPAGNQEGESIFEIGPPASACPNGPATVEGLCN